MEPTETEDVPDLRGWREPMQALGWAALGALAIVNVLNAYAIVAGPWEGERQWLLMEGESNPSTWFSVTALTLTAALAGICAVVDRPQRRRFWTLCALAVLAMSVDDVAMVHERVGGNLSAAIDGERDVSYLWVVPWTAIALVVLYLLWRSRPQLPTRTRNQLLIGAAVIVVSATLLELAAARTLQQYGSRDVPKLILYTLEENLESIGVLVLARAFWLHALHVGDRRGVAAEDAPATLEG